MESGPRILCLNFLHELEILSVNSNHPMCGSSFLEQETAKMLSKETTAQNHTSNLHVSRFHTRFVTVTNKLM
jgi:hypothetical protein